MQERKTKAKLCEMLENAARAQRSHTRRVHAWLDPLFIFILPEIIYEFAK